jgi:hypothetical protein
MSHKQMHHLPRHGPTVSVAPAGTPCATRFTPHLIHAFGIWGRFKRWRFLMRGTSYFQHSRVDHGWQATCMSANAVHHPVGMERR